MSFRLRLTVLASLAVAVAIVGASFVVYYTDRHELISQVDSDLASGLALPPLNLYSAGSSRGFGQMAVGAQARRAGATTLSRGLAPGVFRLVLPRSSTALQVRVLKLKPGGAPAMLRPKFITTTVNGLPTRVLSISSRNEAVTISRSLLDVDRNLSRLKWLLLVISLGGVGAAAILGAFVSGRAVAPLRRLTETTERIVETGDLSERTGLRGRDEISRLSTRLDELLASLEASLRAQRQLVADASHELRTPIATLRANIGLLAHPGTLDLKEREELIDGRPGRAGVDDGAGRGARRARARRGAGRRADRVPARRARAGSRRARGKACARGLLPDEARTVADHRSTGAGRAGSHEPARQRAQVEPIQRDRRCRRSRWPRRGARPRARDRLRGPAPRVQSLLPREGSSRDAGGRPRACRSSSRSPTHTAAASASTRPPTAARSCACSFHRLLRAACGPFQNPRIS